MNTNTNQNNHHDVIPDKKNIPLMTNSAWNLLIAALWPHSIYDDKTAAKGKAFIRSYLKNRQHDGFNDEVDSIWIAKKFNPLCGWDKFMDTINSSGILNLPDQDDIPDCKIAELDGETYVFEWSNKTKYRYYTFWAYSKSPCTENKSFQNFRSFFTSQLGFFEACWPTCWINKN